MPALVAAAARSRGTGAAAAIGGTRLRAFHTGVATPAELVAIITGTWLVETRGPLAPWLMVKLALMVLRVLGHGVCGMLVLRS